MISRFRCTLLATTALVPLGISSVNANPLGANMVSGSATIQGQGTSSVAVTQSTDKAIINWNSFNIGTNEATRFVQPNASSVTLNRVTGNLGPSSLDGTLTANGRIFLVNPDGILFGANSKVNAAGFLATTNDIRNADFMAGKYQFGIAGRPDASIVNLGRITAESSGFAALVAPGVRNAGTISAKLGTVGLASANSFSLDFYGDRLITVGVDDSIAGKVRDVATGQPLDALVKNEGKLKANGGRVELTAAAARQVVDAVINNEGVVEANTIGKRNGMIVLDGATEASKPTGAPAQNLKVSGTLSVAGKRKGTAGGTVVIQGENIALTAAKIDASGDVGGGKVLIGGDTGGGQGNAAVAGKAKAALESFPLSNASQVSVDAATIILASAKTTGDGGKVIVWSDQATTFYGTITAQGGSQSGNGGFVETSGHQSLTFNGTVNTSAPHGANGTLLLDPQDALITTNAGPGIVTVASIQNALANGDVVVTTGSSGTDQGSITVAAGITWSNASALTLSAYQNVYVNSNITNTGGAAVNLRADNTGTGIGTVSFGAGATISTSGPVSIFYNPSVNPAGSAVNPISYANPLETYTSNVTGGASLTAYMLVNTVYDLQNINNNLSGSFALGKDIDATSTAAWNKGSGFIPIGNDTSPFLGNFNGQSHIVASLYINQPLACCVGLFGSVYGNLSNVGLVSVDVTGGSIGVGGLAGTLTGFVDNSFTSGTVRGLSNYVGGLVGILGGTSAVGVITNSHSTAAVSGLDGVGGLVGWVIFPSNILSAYSQIYVQNSYATGVVSGNSYVGGLVGEGSNISGSYATGLVTGTNTSIGGLVGAGSNNIINSYATGNVIGAGSVGGLVGTGGIAAGAAIYGSYATGSVSNTGNLGTGFGGLVGHQTGGSIINSYATGAVSGPSGVGGLVGVAENGNFFSNSYSVSSVSGGSDAGGLIGAMNDRFVTLSNLYWDIAASGQTTGVGRSVPLGFAPGTTGLSAIQFKLGLPIGFDATVWGGKPSINDGYPYLLWQVVSPMSALATPTTLRPAPSLVALTITADPLSKTYGNADPILTYHITSGSLANGDAFSGSLTRASGENVGSYSILQGSLVAPANYNLTFLSSTLVIDPRPITITANAKSKAYGDANPPLTYTLGGLGLVNGDALSGGLATSATAASAVGKYAITQGTLAASSNYAVSYTGTDLTVVPRAITAVGIAADPKTKTYGDADPLLTFQVKQGALVGSDAFTGSLTRTSGENVGSYSILQGTLSLSSNYALTYSGAQLTIQPRPITVTAEAKSKTVGDPNPTLTYVIGGLGLVPGDSLSGSLATTATASSPVGKYPITQGTLRNSNYEITYARSDLSINAVSSPQVQVAQQTSTAQAAANAEASTSQTGSFYKTLNENRALGQSSPVTAYSAEEVFRALPEGSSAGFDWSATTAANFEAAKTTPYGHGYCTDYAKEIYKNLTGKSLNISNDAGTWYDQAVKKPDIQTMTPQQISSVPPGSIVVWKGTKESTAAGHVAVVLSNKDGILEIAQSNWGGYASNASIYQTDNVITVNFNVQTRQKFSYVEAQTHAHPDGRPNDGYALVGFILP